MKKYVVRAMATIEIEREIWAEDEFDARYIANGVNEGLIEYANETVGSQDDNAIVTVCDYPDWNNGTVKLIEDNPNVMCCPSCGEILERDSEDSLWECKTCGIFYDENGEVEDEEEDTD